MRAETEAIRGAAFPAVPLASVCTRITRRVQTTNLPIMMITSAEGFIRQDEKYGRYMAGKSARRYTELRVGEFAYNKGNSKAYPQGCIYRMTEEVAAVPHVYFCFAIDEARFDGDFAAQLFRAGALNEQLKTRINAGVRNNGLLNISADAFFSVSVPLPPLAEQKKVAAILSAADLATEKSEAVIESLRALRKAMMQELQTRGLPGRHTRLRQTEIGEIPAKWSVVALDERLDRLIDYRGRTPAKTSSGVSLITAKNVRVGYVDEEPREYIAAEDYDSWMSRGIPDAGDVLFTTEAPLGNAAALPPGRVALAQRVVTFCPNREVLDPTYLLWQVLGPAFQSQVQAHATGSTVKGIKQRVLRKLPIALPHIDEQRSIAEILDAIQALLDAEHRVRARAVATNSALKSVLLTGELRVA